MTLMMKRISLVATAAGLTILAVVLAIVLTNRGNSATVLTADDVQRQLDAAGPSSSVSFPGAALSSTSNLRRTVVSGKSVSVVAFCDGTAPGGATWSPMPGYRIDQVTHGTGSTVVTLWVESDVANDVRATVTCGTDGSATLTEDEQFDDHGGGKGGSGSGSGPGSSGGPGASGNGSGHGTD